MWHWTFVVSLIVLWAGAQVRLQEQRVEVKLTVASLQSEPGLAGYVRAEAFPR